MGEVVGQQTQGDGEDSEDGKGKGDAEHCALGVCFDGEYHGHAKVERDTEESGSSASAASADYKVINPVHQDQVVNLILQSKILEMQGQGHVELGPSVPCLLPMSLNAYGVLPIRASCFAALNVVCV